jgi:cyclase
MAADGAGELLVTGLHTDGTKGGYDIELIKILASSVSVPITASGGAGKLEDFFLAAEAGATGLLAASLFHYGEVKIPELKDYLKQRGVQTL